ncbi:hypothetical protein [Pseudovibrio denitrificans]|nr:hypothetical protein [Pseudovibrio denitrificans]
MSSRSTATPFLNLALFDQMRARSQPRAEHVPSSVLGVLSR